MQWTLGINPNIWFILEKGDRAPGTQAPKGGMSLFLAVTEVEAQVFFAKAQTFSNL